jgi:hypothetical protein
MDLLTDIFDEFRKRNRMPGRHDPEHGHDHDDGDTHGHHAGDVHGQHASCGNCGKIFHVRQDSKVCPFCGSSLIKFNYS